MMSRSAARDSRRARNQAMLYEANRLREIEEARRASLSTWERIEEADASPDVKEILHMIAEKLGMED